MNKAKPWCPRLTRTRAALAALLIAGAAAVPLLALNEAFDPANPAANAGPNDSVYDDFDYTTMSDGGAGGG
jgi:hypothetical protein